MTASSSSVDEAVAQRVLGNGGAAPSTPASAPARPAPARPASPARNPNLRRVKIDGAVVAVVAAPPARARPRPRARQAARRPTHPGPRRCPTRVRWPTSRSIPAGAPLLAPIPGVARVRRPTRGVAPGPARGPAAPPRPAAVARRQARAIPVARAAIPAARRRAARAPRAAIPAAAPCAVRSRAAVRVWGQLDAHSPSAHAPSRPTRAAKAADVRAPATAARLRRPASRCPIPARSPGPVSRSPIRAARPAAAGASPPPAPVADLGAPVRRRARQPRRRPATAPTPRLPPTARAPTRPRPRLATPLTSSARRATRSRASGRPGARADVAASSSILRLHAALRAAVPRPTSHLVASGEAAGVAASMTKRPNHVRPSARSSPTSSASTPAPRSRTWPSTSTCPPRT